MCHEARELFLTSGKHALTTLYNARPTCVQHAHAVWAVSGWDDPYLTTVEEDTILTPRLALIHERSNPSG